MRGGLAHNGVGARFRRRAAPGKARHRQIKAAPKEMHRATFAEKAPAEHLKDPVDLHQDAPKAVGVLRIVRSMHMIVRKGDRVFRLIRYGADSGALAHRRRAEAA